MSIRKTDLWAGTIFLSLGLLLVLVLIPLGIDEPRKVKYAVLSPSNYPRLVGIALAIIGLAISVRAWRRVDDGVDPDSDTPLERIAAAKLAVVAAVLLAIALLLPWAGFVLAAAVAQAVLMVLGGERRIVLILAIPVLMPLALYLFFGKVAGIPIPGGILDPFLRSL